MPPFELDAQDLPVYLARLKVFYQNLMIYFGINIILFLWWLLFSHGSFWPGIVIVAWGVGLLIQAALLGMLPKAEKLQNWRKYTSTFNQCASVFHEDWEKNKMKDLGPDTKVETPAQEPQKPEKVSLPIKPKPKAKPASAKKPSSSKSSAKKTGR